MNTLTMTDTEFQQILGLINEPLCTNLITKQRDGQKAIRNLVKLAFRLPPRIVDFLIDFKYDENNLGVCLIKGFKVDQNKISSTPSHWKDNVAEDKTLEESLFLLLCSALIGDPIAWNTQQEGRLVHNIVPINGDEYKQIGSSTLTPLWWHTEEAFHPFRCDYLGLFCLRNNEKAGTTFGSIQSLDIPDKYKQDLFEPKYSIYPDLSHLVSDTSLNNFSSNASVLFGNFEKPYLRIDPYYMGKTTGSKKADYALKYIISEINRNMKTLILDSGDILFIDNYRVVHGRESFKAFFDGNGRWLKRVNIVRDLRKSRGSRIDSDSRIIQTT